MKRLLTATRTLSVPLALCLLLLSGGASTAYPALHAMGADRHANVQPGDVSKKLTQKVAFTQRIATLQASDEMDSADQRLPLSRQQVAEVETGYDLSQFLMLLMVLLCIAAVAMTWLIQNRRSVRQIELNHRQASERLRNIVAQRSRALSQEMARRQETERHQSELEKRLLREDQLRSLGKLTSGIAHDFNNLMQVVMGSAEMLEATLEGPERQLARDIIRAAQTGRSVTWNLLAYAQRQPLQPTQIELNAYLRAQHPMLKHCLDADHELVIETDAGPATIEADESQLTSSLIRLLVNACEATEGEGPVRLSVSRRGDHIALAIEDRGRGMTREDVQRATEPYYSTKDTGDDNETSSNGLGLSMVFGFMRQSGGELLLESAPGKGTLVTLLFTASAPVPANGC